MSSRSYHHDQSHMSGGETLKEPGLSSPVKRWISVDTGAACNYWKEVVKITEPNSSQQ